MKKTLLAVSAALVATGGFGADLTKATFTRVINQVKVVSAATKTITPAKVNTEFSTPDLIQTGPRSLAELKAPDNTITRVGANTIFSYERHGRTVNLQRGSLLFHSPRGKGGGVIRTKAASASVLGTTIMVAATADGGFKCVVLEGKAALQMPNGNYRVARPGQVVFVAPGGENFGPTVDINLEKVVEKSKLVNLEKVAEAENQAGEAPRERAPGQNQPESKPEAEKVLPSIAKIKKAVVVQRRMIESGKLERIETDPQLAPATGAAQGDAVPTVTKETVETAVLSFGDRFRTAIGTDLIITGQPFPPEHLFNIGYNTIIPGISRTFFRGLLAHNLGLLPPSGSSSLSLDFTDFLAAGSFDLVADAVLAITGPQLNLFSTGLPGNLIPTATTEPDPDFELALIGRTGVRIASGTQIFASSVGNLTLGSGASMELNNLTVQNQHRSLDFLAAGLLAVNGGNYTASSTGQHIRFRSSDGNVEINGAAISADLFEITSGEDTVLSGNNTFNTRQATLSASGGLSITGAGSLNASQNIAITTGQDANISGNATFNTPSFALTSSANASVSQVSFTSQQLHLAAAQNLTLNAVNLSSATSIALEANTINLSSINFPGGSSVTLNSALGLLAPNPNTGAASVPGHVNFIQNVNYNNQPAQFFVGSTITIGTR